MDISSILQAILFGLFALLTAALAAITGPTYDNLLVPELASGSLFPSLPPAVSAGSSFLSRAADLSAYVLANVVDPAIALIALGVGGAYLLRSFLSRWALPLQALLPKMVVSVILANFSLPIAGAVLGVAGAMYPVIAGFDGGAWRQWVNLGGYGEVGFSYDNGLLAFVLSFVLFTLVLLLTLAVALRDAMLGVVLVLLPLFTVLWPIPVFASLARRVWFLFIELAFLPCILVIPLELAVGSPNVLLLVAYLSLALASPYFVSISGAQLQGAGFPSAGATLSSGVQRGLAVASGGVESYVRPASVALQGQSTAAKTVGLKAFGAGFPAAAPLLVGEFLGRGAAHLARHLRPGGVAGRVPNRFPKVVRGPP